MARKHYVTFYSPGSFFAESTTAQIESWDPIKATQMSAGIVERYGSKPFGFRFDTRLVSDPVPDGEGGTLRVAPKVVETSGMYHINGTVETLDDLEKRADPREDILRSNMRCNRMVLVVVTTSSYRSTQAFDVADVVVDSNGTITERGDSPKWAEYRARKIAEIEAAGGYR
jgi:hypothetical protein